MTHNGDEVRALLEQAAGLPYGSAQMVEVGGIIRKADALGDRRLMFDARMLGSDAYTFGGEPARAFVTFSWCLAEFDKGTDIFTPLDDEQLRWQYKWIVSSLRDFPEIPLPRTVALLDDMERRYRLGGHSLHAVYTLRWRLARHLGDTTATDRWFDLWCATPRDENSDCEGCDPTSKVEHLVDRGRDEEAIALAEPVLAGRLTCLQQPHSMLTELMIPYVRTGRLDEARDAHIRGYRGVCGNLASLSEIAQHIEFCGLTGNESRGLELIERHLEWLDRAPTPRAAMRFAASAALVLGNLVAAGRGGVTIYRRATPHRTAAPEPVAELAEEMTAVARDLASRFDRRNATGTSSAEVERLLGADPLVEWLPLSAVASAVARRSAGDPLPTRSEHAPRVMAARDRMGRARAQLAGELPDSLELDEFLDLMEQALGERDDEHRFLALWTLFANRFPMMTAVPEDWLARVRTLEAQVVVVQDQDHARAEKPFREAAELYRRQGAEASARLVETWLGRSLARIGDTAQGISMIEEAIAWLRANGHTTSLARAELRLAEALCVGQRFGEALSATDRAMAERCHDPAETTSVRVGLTRSFCLLALGRFEEVVELTRALGRQARDLGRSDMEGFVNICLGHALEGIGDGPSAVDAFEVVLATTDDPHVVAQARTQRAHLLANSPKAGEVVDELVEIVAELVARGDDASASASAQFDLAIAYHVAGQLLDAAEMAETAVRALGGAGMHAAADRCRYRLSKIYTDLGEADQALAILDELVSRLDGFDNLHARGQVHEDAARILFRSDRETAAATRFHSAQECYSAADLPYDAARVLRARAVALSWGSDPATGLEALETAQRFVDSLPTSAEATLYELAMLDVDAAQVLANLDRPEEAANRLAEVPGRLRVVGAYGEALEAELLRARLLLGLGEMTDGEAVLRSVIGASPHDTAVHRAAVWTLVVVMEETGRRVDATALRAAYGFPESDEDDDLGVDLEED